MYTYRAVLIRVIDGDTVVLDLDLGFKLARRNESYRLGRIDAPEMNTTLGPIARDHLTGLLEMASSLQATTSKADKYGRWLVELFADGVNVNDQMVSDGQAIYRTY